MKINFSKHLVTATLLVAAIGGVAPRVEATQRESAAVIIEWNQLAQLRIGGPPFSQLRQYAMLHVAMADAVVAIEGRYEPFKFDVRAPHGASARAAAAQAARDILVYLIPASAAEFNTKLAADLASIPPGPRWNGVQVGKKVAAWVIGWRQNDGFASADPADPADPLSWPPDYVPVFEASILPGIWRPTASGRPSFAKLGDVEPFGVLSPTQFLPDAMPQLESAEYAADFNEVKTEGEKPNPLPATKEGYTAKHRTALLWANGAPFTNVTNPFRVWFNVARDVGPSLSLVQTARLFALLATSMFDGVQTSQTSKFVYRLWRPETAIANAGPVGGDADYDDNPDTLGQPGWIPLLTTPPYPSHSSNMQCIGASAARTLRNVFDTDKKAFTVKWFASDGTVVHQSAYKTFSSLSVEEGNSRVWGGIHFRFELTDSIESCSNVADYIFDTKMQQRGYSFK